MAQSTLNLDQSSTEIFFVWRDCGSGHSELNDEIVDRFQKVLSIGSLLACVIRRTCEWTRFNVAKPERHSDVAPLRKLFRCDVTLDR